MSPEPQIQPNPLPIVTINDIIYSEEFLHLQDPHAQRDHLLERVKLDWQTIQQVSHLTTGQRDNPSWQMIRTSPDGLVGDNSVLEAKCPYTQKNLTIQEAIATNNFYLEKKDGKIVLKKDHVYWHQPQSQMHLAKKVKGYFVVWTTMDFVVLEIQRDDTWGGANVKELQDFYLKHLLPKIIEGEL